MIYLFLSVIFSSIIAVSFKYAQKKSMETKGAILVNYATAAVGSAVQMFAQNGSAVMQHSVSVPMVAAGICTGGFLCVNLDLMRVSTNKNGLGSTTFFNRISFLLCIVFSAAALHEYPKMMQILSVMVLLAALGEMFLSMRAEEERFFISYFMLLFATGGIIEIGNKLFATLFDNALRPAYLCVVFISALAVYGVRYLKKGGSIGQIDKPQLIIGVVMGCSNLLSNYLKLKSLQLFPSSVVFSTFAAGNLLLTTVAGWVLFREKTNRHMVLSIVLAAISMVLNNI